jgi:hypothetical protein
LSVHPIRFCPGAKSPFGDRLYRRCTEFCECYRWGATDMAPAMKWNPEVKARECVNMVPRGDAS